MLTRQLRSPSGANSPAPARGMPVVVDALEVYGRVLGERGEPFPGEEGA